MPPARLILVAHAATTATRRAAFARGDETIEPASLAAAAALATALPPIQEALASPAPCAAGTAAALGLDAQSDLRLRDLDVGDWIGRASADIPGPDVAAWLGDADYTGHNGESLAALVERLAAFLTARLGVRGTTIAVTHAAVVRAALVAALDAPPAAFWRIEVPPLAVLVLGGDGRRWMVRGLGPPETAVRASGG